MGDETEEDRKTVALARRFLEDRATSHQTLESLTMEGIKILDFRKGFLRCHFVVSSPIALPTEMGIGKLEPWQRWWTLWVCFQSSPWPASAMLLVIPPSLSFPRLKQRKRWR